MLGELYGGEGSGMCLMVSPPSLMYPSLWSSNAYDQGGTPSNKCGCLVGGNRSDPTGQPYMKEPRISKCCLLLLPKVFDHL